MGFSRQFTGGYEDVADARQFVAATLLRDSELYEAARLLVDEAITNPLLHSEACETTRAFQVTIACRPDLLHVEVHDGGVPLPLDRDRRPTRLGRRAQPGAVRRPGARLGLLRRAGPARPRGLVRAGSLTRPRLLGPIGGRYHPPSVRQGARAAKGSGL